MSGDLEALARRAVACPAWRWMERMVALPGAGGLHPGLGRVVVDDVAGGVPQRWHHERALHFSVWRCWAVDFPAALPDLADPATLGCLLALVREAWGDSGATTYNEKGRWGCSMGDGCTGLFPTEAAALVAALEAAPDREVKS